MFRSTSLYVHTTCLLLCLLYSTCRLHTFEITLSYIQLALHMLTLVFTLLYMLPLLGPGTQQTAFGRLLKVGASTDA